MCGGGGMRVIEMNFLPDVYVHCEKCNGKRYNRETLEIRYKGKSMDAEQIGADLGVDAVMSGRLIQRGDDLVISVDLIVSHFDLFKKFHRLS